MTILVAAGITNQQGYRMGIMADRRQVVQLVDRWGPVFHLRDAQECGVSRGVLLRLQDRGEVLRLAKASWAIATRFHAASPAEQFRLRAIAFGLSHRQDAHLTGPAAALLLGLPLLTDPPGLPQAIRPGDPHTGHDRSPYGRIRHGYLPEIHRTVRHRVPVVGPAFCAVDIARHAGPLDGLVIADAVLHGGVDRSVLHDLIGHMLAYPGIRAAQWVAEHADSRCESPLETLGRYAFISAGLRPPLSNVWIRAGDRWFRADHLVRETGVIMEADGALKYNDRADADTVIAGEKERERLLRSAGFGIARYTWADALNRPWIIPARALEAAEHRIGRPPPADWRLEAPWAAKMNATADAAARPNSWAM